MMELSIIGPHFMAALKKIHLETDNLGIAPFQEDSRAVIYGTTL